MKNKLVNTRGYKRGEGRGEGGTAIKGQHEEHCGDGKCSES